MVTTYCFTAEMVKFFIAAAHYHENLLGRQLADLSSDPFTSPALRKDRAFYSLPLYKELDSARHLRAWLDTAFIILQGDNRDNRRFMKAFTAELRAKEMRPIELKQDEYTIMMGTMNASRLKEPCALYLQYLREQRDVLAAGSKVASKDLDALDATLERLSEIMNSEMFSEEET